MEHVEHSPTHGVRKPLPIDPHLPGVVEALERHGAAVLVAPPGAGKTTRVPPALVRAGLLGTGACWVLEPRRVAARAAARRVAAEQGWDLGGPVGFHVRHDRRGGPETRIWYATEGVFLARLQADPALEGVGAVVLDEFHERSLEADLLVAFLREVREALRPDLRLLVCSATLEPEPVAAFLGAPVLRVPGRTHPVEIRYLERPDPAPLPRRVARGVRRVWPQRPGGRGTVLAFLPGAREIRAAARELASWAREVGVEIVPLHGDLPAHRQDRALDPAGRPRVVLSTNVAETGLTLPGVTAVVDGGYARVLRWDPATGIDRLETVPASRAAADQRAGRAGRTGPGLALRLWTRHDDRTRPDRAEPAIRRVDLCRAVLEVVAWGHPDPATFPWFEPPDPGRLEASRELLRELGALDPGGGLTDRGERLRRLPLPPRLGVLALEAAARGLAQEGALLAALLEERDVVAAGRAFGAGGEAPTGPSDLLWRAELLEEAARSRFDLAVLERLGLDPAACRAVWQAAAQVRSLLRAMGAAGPAAEPGSEESLLRAVLAAFPDRVARRRSAGTTRFVLAGGRGAVLDRRSAVRRHDWIVAVRLEDSRRPGRPDALIRWASRIDPAWLAELAPLERTRLTEFDGETLRVRAREVRRFRGLAVDERACDPDPERAADLLARAVARDPARLLGLSRDVRRWVARCRFLAEHMLELRFPRWSRDEWEELIRQEARGRRSVAELQRVDWGRALRARLSPAQVRALERHAPDRVRVPSGRAVALEYPEDGPPVLAVPVQEVFGWRQGPRVAGGRVAVLLHLLGPHGRPLQVTTDLESFWRNTYPEVRKEMRGRYPKHHWPEDPWSAEPGPSVRRTTRR